VLYKFIIYINPGFAGKWPLKWFMYMIVEADQTAKLSMKYAVGITPITLYATTRNDCGLKSATKSAVQRTHLCVI